MCSGGFLFFLPPIFFFQCSRGYVDTWYLRFLFLFWKVVYCCNQRALNTRNELFFSIRVNTAFIVSISRFIKMVDVKIRSLSFRITKLCCAFM